MLKGIDISNHQRSFNPGGQDFVIFKASEGKTYKDPLLDAHYNRLHGSRDGRPDPAKLYGFYHYARPENGNTATAEADHFLSLVGHHAGHAIFALDFEGAALKFGVAWPLAWLKRVYQRTGVRPLFYCSASQTGRYAAIARENFGLWVAHYGVKRPAVRGWPFWAIWQTDARGVDHDLFNGDKRAWQRYCRGVRH